MLALGAAGLGALAVGDGGREVATTTRPLARGRAVIRPEHEPHGPRPGVMPPRLAPLPARTDAIHRLPDLYPTAPPHAVALTIDDGPQPEWTPKMLDLLAEFDVRATFSLIGIQVKLFPKLAERIVQAGHQLCNHTMTHPLDIASLSRKNVDREITEAHDRIGHATGVAPKFFRSPGGNWSHAVFHSAARHGMIPIDWDIDPRDWSRPGTGHIKRAMLKATGGDILLCHDGGGDRSETIKALRKVIPQLKKRGLTFVPL
jgi:peptidoglycan/xylan/chitin deacetylase (PgdA/CDA1 family)